MSDSTMRVAAIIVAAGSGTRFGGEGPKQFVDLNGKAMFRWSTDVFTNHPDIDQVLLIAPPDMVQDVRAAIAVADVPNTLNGKRLNVVAGGASRQESVFNGLSALAAGDGRPTHVLVHDAARPFVTAEIVDRVIAKLRECDACTAAIPASDTVKRVTDGTITETLNRQELHLVQTPQGALFDALYAAHQTARKKQHATTDDAAVLEAAGISVQVVLGSRINIKVTEKEDLLLSLAIATIIGDSQM